MRRAQSPTSWLDELVTMCFTMLIGAAALYVVVKLIVAIWVPLLIILLVGISIAGIVIAIRWRRHGW